jgi:glucan phosphoethanolaminetransferase (alkaline phosphatase superfamily)
VAVTLFTGIAFTSADFFTLPSSSIKDVAFLFVQWAVVMFVLFPTIHLLTLNRYVFAAVFPALCLLSGILTWFRYTAGTVLTTMLLDAATDNDAKITAELLSGGLFTIAGLSLLAGCVFTFWRWRSRNALYTSKPRRRFTHLFLAVIWIASVFSIWQIRLPVAEKVPFNLYFVTARWLAEKREYLKERPPLPGKVVCGEDKPLVIFILGESLRADHLGLNGYERNTTPRLAKEEVITFPYIYSEATLTNTSLPFLFTRADSLHPERGASERSFIDLFKRCGYRTVWIANQEPADSYVYFMHECDTLIFGNIDKSPYVFDAGWNDRLLLPHFDALMSHASDAHLIILHTIGSHWYYNAHYQELNDAAIEYYKPVTHSRIVTSNASEEMLNSYDNTILFTDYFISEIINRIRDREVIVVYLSDHGEALGEDGRWLHANDVAAAHNPACFVWLSPRYREAYPARYEALNTNRLRHFDVAFLFHTITESANIEAETVEADKSLFRLKD